MPELYSAKHIISILLRNGFKEVSQKGSHKEETLCEECHDKKVKWITPSAEKTLHSSKTKV